MRYTALNILRDKSKVALVLLNQPLRRDLLDILWARSVVTVAVDGATSRLYDMLSDHEREHYVPHYVTGDFDSSRQSTRDYYKKKGSKVIKTLNQDATDFTKSLHVIAPDIANSQDCECVVVLGALGGRLDHTLSNINTLYISPPIVPELPIYLISDESLAVLLHSGDNEIEVNSGFEDEWCGFIPMGQPCNQVSTSGLKWNLDNDAMQFGGLISTSNTYDGSPVVKITTDQSLLWTMGYRL